MNPAAQQPLPLKDIHLPDPISWWPLAPGWWGLVILILLLLGLFFLGRALYRRGQLRREAHQALQDIQTQHKIHQDDRQLAADLSTLLRRVTLSYSSRADVASLTDDAWLYFLDRGVAKTKFKDAFSNGAGRVLIDAPYKPTVNIDSAALLKICTAWIEALPHKTEAHQG
ncbi:DUF4381 domain-containing protein [Pseudomonadota bacterium]